MKVESEDKLTEPIKLHAQKEIEKKTVFIGSTKLTPGHRVFEINERTLDCSEAKYETEVHFNAPNKRKIIIKEGCVYICALNSKNALKRYKRDFK